MERLDQSCHLPVGTRDATHVPFVVARAADVPVSTRLATQFLLTPGSYVKFTNEEYTEFVVCEKKEAHGILNPFLDEILYYDTVVVLLIPGITTPVRHNFDINPKIRETEHSILEAELAERKAEDPDCAGCWHIRNNRVSRS